MKKSSLLLAVIVVITSLSLSGQKSSYSGGSSSGSSSQGSGGSGDQSGGGGGKNSGGGGGASGGGGGFSIESEMLAYKALESDSEAIACDVAVYLIYEDPTVEPQDYRDPTSPNDIFPAGAQASHSRDEWGARWNRLKYICGRGVGRDFSPVQASPRDTEQVDGSDRKKHPVEIRASQQKARQESWGVIVLASSDTTIANVQTWRVNMALMGILSARAAAVECCPEGSSKLCTKPKQDACKCPKKECPTPEDYQKYLEMMQSDGTSAGMLPGGAAATSAISLIQSAVQLFAVNESVSGVTGTIQDQALIDGIARHFRAMAIPVLAPGTYPSFGLEAKWKPDSVNPDGTVRLSPSTGYGIQNSPFLIALQKLTSQRICLARKILELSGQTAAGDTSSKASTKAKLAELQAIAASIDTFIASLFGGTAPKAAAQDSTTDNADQASADGNKGKSSTPSKKDGSDTSSKQTTIQPQPNAPINAILTADGIIRRLNWCLPEARDP